MGIESYMNNEEMERKAKKLDSHLQTLENKISDLSLSLNKCSKMLDDTIMNDAKKLIEDFKKILNNMNEAAKPITKNLQKASQMGKKLERGL
jgi:DNA anti-recombination protein RmuC